MTSFKFNNHEIENPESEDPPILKKHKAISISHRFNIMLVLYSNRRIGFTKLRKITELTKGNLSHHLSYLEDIGWIKEGKLVSYRPLSYISITSLGESEFHEYIQNIRESIKNIE